MGKAAAVDTSGSCCFGGGPDKACSGFEGGREGTTARVWISAYLNSTSITATPPAGTAQAIHNTQTTVL